MLSQQVIARADDTSRPVLMGSKKSELLLIQIQEGKTNPPSIAEKQTDVPSLLITEIEGRGKSIPSQQPLVKNSP